MASLRTGARAWRVVVAVAFASLAVLWWLALPAAAAVDGDCTGEATIGGTTYDHTATRIDVPADPDLVIPWHGEVGFDNRNHNGRIRVVIGPGGVTVGEWGDPNDGDDRSAEDVYQLADFFDRAPVDLTGAHLLRGHHEAAGGRCDGEFLVVFEGNPLGNPVGVGAHVGLLAAVAAVAAAARIH